MKILLREFNANVGKEDIFKKSEIKVCMKLIMVMSLK